jgi:flavin-dependent dehydrogenase
VTAPSSFLGPLARLRGRAARRDGSLALQDGSRVGVIGGGPAGSFFTIFLLAMADSLGLDLRVDIFEPRFFTHRGPAGCNHCGGIVSESLVQMLAAEGINLPPSVVQQGIDSYILHTDVGDVRIQSPRDEKRIAAVYRGNGPRESEPVEVAGFDRHLLDLSASQGARVVRKMAQSVEWIDGRPRVTCPDGSATDFDLLVVATGVNSQAMNLFSDAAHRFAAPATQRTFICEFRLGADVVRATFGTSMHVFLLDIPRLGFAAIVPKGEFVTLCLLGDDLDETLVENFLRSAEVQRCFPGGTIPPLACHCYPRINVEAATRPFGDRIVWIGDSGVARLYKDGIGSAYRTAKAAAKTAVFSGVSTEDFRRHFWPACRALDVDNMIARVVFGVTHLIQHSSVLRRGVVRMTAREQAQAGSDGQMSSVLWDTFTGSAPYRDILKRTMRPQFPVMLAWNVIAGSLPFGGAPRRGRGHGE